MCCPSTRLKLPSASNTTGRCSLTNNYAGRSLSTCTLPTCTQSTCTLSTLDYPRDPYLPAPSLRVLFLRIPSLRVSYLPACALLTCTPLTCSVPSCSLGTCTLPSGSCHSFSLTTCPMCHPSAYPDDVCHSYMYPAYVYLLILTNLPPSPHQAERGSQERSGGLHHRHTR